MDTVSTLALLILRTHHLVFSHLQVSTMPEQKYQDLRVFHAAMIFCIYLHAIVQSEGVLRCTFDMDLSTRRSPVQFSARC